MICCFLSEYSSLLHKAKRRQRAAFRPGTNANHMSQIRLFTAFCIYFNLEHVQTRSDTLCAYIEFLTRSFKAPDSIRNYISGIKHYFRLRNLPLSGIESYEVQLMLRALDLTMLHIRRPRPYVSVNLIYALVANCHFLGDHGLILKTAILFAFFGMLRRSNLAPDSGNMFEPKRHTCRDDIIKSHPGLIILLKWSKTCQDFKSVSLVPLPALPGHPMCPLEAFNAMVHTFPAKKKNSALFINKAGLPVTTTWLAQQLNILSHLANLKTKITWHDFRRAGAELCFKAGLECGQIKQHGIWRSDAFWVYISQYARCEGSQVPAAMAKAVLGT